MLRTEPLIRTSILVELRRIAEARGLDLLPLMHEVGLGETTCAAGSFEELDLRAMVPVDALARLFELASQRTSDPCFGLRMARALRPEGASLLGELVGHAPTIRDFLKCAAGFVHVFITRVEAGFAEMGGIGRLYWRPAPVRGSAVQINLFFVASLVHRLRRAAGADWVPMAVELPHRPLECRETSLLVFGDRVRYNCLQTSVTIDHATLGRPMPDADPVKFALLRDLAQRWLEEINTPCDLSTKTSRQIAVLLKTGDVDLDTVAQALGMSARTLRSRLEQLGTSFDQVVSETKAQIAQRLLRDTDLPLTAIAMELGFSDASAFSRAARRWFQMPPRAYRKLHRDSPATEARRL